MASATQLAIREVLRDYGPLSLDDLLPHVLNGVAIKTKIPKKTVQAAEISYDNPLVASTGEGRYAYLPTFINGAAMRVPLDMVALECGLLALPAEVAALLWPLQEHRALGPRPILALEGGPVVAVEWDEERRSGPFIWQDTRSVIGLPPPFWNWLAVRQAAGADALVFRTANGESGQFAVSAIRTSDLDPAAVEASNERLRSAAAQALKLTRGVRIRELGRRLLGRGVYHTETPPDPLLSALFSPPGPFYVEGVMQIAHRADLTPVMWRLFGNRLNPLPEVEGWVREEMEHPETAAERDMDLTGRLGPEPALMEVATEDLMDDLAASVESDGPSGELKRPAPGEQAHRLKLTLEADPKVWRTVEILAGQSLEDLHLAIQDAFHWDNDHLFSFYLGGKAWDNLTEIAGLPPYDRAGFAVEPPTADVITLGELGPRRGQRLLYLFDYGDEWTVEVRVQQTVNPAPTTRFPRIVEEHGTPPPQYPVWGDEADWDDEDDLDTPDERGAT